MSSDAATVKQINTQCNAISEAVLALKPTHVVLQTGGKWVVMSDADYAVATRTNPQTTVANVWKQGSNYAWVHAVSYGPQGQRATQLCFRQSDGSLARARQATSVPALSAVSAQQAFYSSSGQLIQKTSAFAEDDPMLAKTVNALPFYAVLPQ